MAETYTPIKHEEFKDFYIIPGEAFSNYLINDNLEVLTLVDTGHKNKRGSILKNMSYRANNSYTVNKLRKPNNGEWFKMSTKVLLQMALTGPIETKEKESEVDLSDFDFVTDYTKKDFYLKNIDNFPTYGELSMTIKEKEEMKRVLLIKLDKLEQVARKNKK